MKNFTLQTIVQIQIIKLKKTNDKKSENKDTTTLAQDQFIVNGEGVELTVKRINRWQANSTFYIVDIVLIIVSSCIEENNRIDQYINKDNLLIIKACHHGMVQHSNAFYVSLIISIEHEFGAC